MRLKRFVVPVGVRGIEEFCKFRALWVLMGVRGLLGIQGCLPCVSFFVEDSRLPEGLGVIFVYEGSSVRCNFGCRLCFADDA